MKRPPVTIIALIISVLAVVCMAFTVPTLDGSVREALMTGKPCVLALVLAIWGGVLAGGVAGYVHPVPKTSWAAIAIAVLVIIVFLVMIHAGGGA